MDPADLERARTFFAEGVDFADQEQWSQAASRFRSALEIRAAAAVKYNLAAALMEMNEYREAYRLLGEVSEDPEASEDQKQLAHSAREEIRSSAGSIEVDSVGGTGAETVAIDGEVVEGRERGGPIYVSPGSHRVEMRDESGAVVGTETVRVEAGQNSQALVTIASAEEEEVFEAPASSTDIPTQLVIWGSVAVGITLLVGMIVFASDGDGVAPDRPRNPIQGFNAISF